MSDEQRVVKKRGRPKKTAEVDTVVVIDTSTDSVPPPSTRVRKSNGRKASIQSSETEAIPKKRVSRKTVAKVEDEVVTPQIARTSKIAKNIDKALSTLNIVVDSPVQSQVAPQLNILEQATAFRDTSKHDSASQIIEALDGGSDETTVELKHVYTQLKPSLPVIDQHQVNTIESGLVNITSTIRQVSLGRIELSISRLANELDISTESLSNLQSSIKQRANNAQQAQKLIKQVSDIEEAVQRSTSTVQTVIQNRRARQFHTARSTLDILTAEAQELSSELSDLKSQRQFQHDSAIQSLTSQIAILSNAIQHSASVIQQHNLPAQQSPLSIPPSQPTSEVTMHPHSQPQLQTSTPPQPTITRSPATQLPSKTQSKYQATAYPQPQPRSPRPTELPYETLRKDPKFKRESRKWTGIIVGIPVLVATSWVLYKRHQDTLRKRFGPEDKGRKRGELPGGKGEVRRSSDVGFNGGV